MILVGLGSSLPFLGASPASVVERAFSALDRLGRLACRSSLYESPAWPDERDPPFINAVASLQTELPPGRLLAAFLGVEVGFGRRRDRPNAPRTLDLDLLDYNGLIRIPIGPQVLALPHPRLTDRDFVLAPLTEIAPEWRHPESGETARSLLSRLPRQTARRI